MTIEKKLFGEDELLIKPIGRLDLDSTPEFEEEINKDISHISYLTVDLSDVNYISSIGLRAILAFQKQMNEKGEMRITNVNSEVLEIFKTVGFDKFLNII